MWYNDIMEEEDKIQSLETKVRELREQIEVLNAKLAHEKELLDECYALIYYKGAWLSLSDENIKGLRKHREGKKAPKGKKGKIEAECLWGV